MPTPLETADIQIDTIGVNAAVAALSAVTGGLGEFSTTKAVDVPEAKPPARPAVARPAPAATVSDAAAARADRVEQDQSRSELDDLKDLDPTIDHDPAATRADRAEHEQSRGEIKDLMGLDRTLRADPAAEQADRVELNQGRGELEDLKILDPAAASRPPRRGLTLPRSWRRSAPRNDLLARIADAAEHPGPSRPPSSN